MADAPDLTDPTGQRRRPVDFGAVLVVAALVVVGAMVLAIAANVIRSWHFTGIDGRTGSTVERLQIVVDSSIDWGAAAFLLGAALVLMVAAVFSDVGSRWLDRALGITAAVASLVAVAALFDALQIPSWNGEAGAGMLPGNPYDDGVLHVAHAMRGLATIVLAVGAVAVCWLTVSGRVRDRLGDDDEVADDPE